MNFYNEHILPSVIDFGCSMKPVMEQRRRLLGKAGGRVLEVGMGSGLNLAFYDPHQVELVWGLEPSAGMRRRAAHRLAASPVKVELLDLPGEEIPLEDNSVDTVVLTFTLCTIADWRAALAQMYRVMKPGATLLFCEHGRARDKSLQKWQDRITPLWKGCFGGCHLNRPMDTLITESGFAIDSMENFFMPRTPRFAGYLYLGHGSKPHPNASEPCA